MNTEQVIKSTQEQATAAWIGYLNQLRLDNLLNSLAKQDLNLKAALEILQDAKSTIAEEIIGKNRGGSKGMHGFIAEVLEVAFGNADSVIRGNQPNHIWINDNGPVDFIRDGTMLQQKFVQSDKLWGLSHIVEHLSKYPDFIKDGGKYQIPKDFYEIVQKLAAMSSDEARTLTKNSDGLSYSNWEKIQEFFKNSGISPSDIEPSSLKYKEVQKNVTDRTIASKEAEILDADTRQRQAALDAGKPSFKEGVDTTLVSALFEGSVEFCLGVHRKLKAGKKLHDFTTDDWKELGINSAGATAKGGIRGASVYLLTNYANTPDCVATAFMTAVFGIVAQAKHLREGTITEYEFVDNIAVLTLDVSVSAVSSFIGSCIIPGSMLGPIIGNAVGMFLYGIAKDFLSAKEQKLINNFINEVELLNAKLDVQYKKLIQELRSEFEKFSSIVDLAFSEEANNAFVNSVVLADYTGASSSALRNIHDIDDYFMN